MTDNDLEAQISLQPETRFGRFWNFVKIAVEKTGIRNLVPFIIIIVYSLIGAVSFILLEKQNDIENRRERRLEIDAVRNGTVDKLTTVTVSRDALMEIIVSHENEIGSSYPSDDTIWDFWNAMFFAGTVYTTIGYGNIACATWQGRLVTIFYAIVGIPLSLVVLNHLTKIMFTLILKFRVLWRACCKCACVWYKKTKLSQLHMEERIRLLIFDKTGDIILKHEPNFPSDRMKSEPMNEDEQTPLLGALIVTIAWLFFCAGLFCLWETWTYFTSFYFFCISLSTIGFGDIVPEYPKYMCMNFALVLVGLALVSVCFAAIQEKLQNFYMSYLIKLLNEYEKLAESGESETSASIGMARMFVANPRARLMLNLLGKDKRRIVMQTFKEKASDNDVPVPWALSDLDKETNMPSIFKAVENSNIDQWTQKLEDYLKRKGLKLQPVSTPEEQKLAENLKDQKQTQNQKLYVNYEQQTDISCLDVSDHQLINELVKSSSVKTSVDFDEPGYRLNKEVSKSPQEKPSVDLSDYQLTKDGLKPAPGKNNVDVTVSDRQLMTKALSNNLTKSSPQKINTDKTKETLINGKQFVDASQQTISSKINKREAMTQYPILSKIGSIFDKNSKTATKKLQTMASSLSLADTGTQTIPSTEAVSLATVQKELMPILQPLKGSRLSPDSYSHFEPQTDASTIGLLFPSTAEGVQPSAVVVSEITDSEFDVEATITVTPKNLKSTVDTTEAEVQPFLDRTKYDYYSPESETLEPMLEPLGVTPFTKTTDETTSQEVRENENLMQPIIEKGTAKRMLAKMDQIQMVDNWSQTVPYLPRTACLQLTDTGTQTRPLPFKKSESVEIWWYYSWSEIGCQTAEPLMRSRKIQTVSLEAEDILVPVRHPVLQKATSFYEKIAESGFAIPENTLQPKKSIKYTPASSYDPLYFKLDNQTQTLIVDTYDKKTQTKEKETKCVETQYGKSYCANPYGPDVKKIGKLIQQFDKPGDEDRALLDMQQVASRHKTEPVEDTPHTKLKVQHDKRRLSQTYYDWEKKPFELHVEVERRPSVSSLYSSDVIETQYGKSSSTSQPVPEKKKIGKLIHQFDKPVDDDTSYIASRHRTEAAEDIAHAKLKIQQDISDRRRQSETDDRRRQSIDDRRRQSETHYDSELKPFEFHVEDDRSQSVTSLQSNETLSRTNSSLEDQSTGSGTSKHERKKINWTPVPKDDTEGQAPKAIEVVLKPGQKVKDLKHLFEHH